MSNVKCKLSKINIPFYVLHVQVDPIKINVIFMAQMI